MGVAFGVLLKFIRLNILNALGKRLTRTFAAGTFLLMIFFAQKATALMLPHIDSSIPANGVILMGNTVRFYGYSLGHGDIEMLKVNDLTTKANDHICNGQIGPDGLKILNVP